MREIKFRAFNKSEKKMCRVVSTDFEDMVTVRFPEFEGEEYYDDYNDDMELNEFEPLMQFTGLVDKNGVEIYESDIIKVNKLTFDSSNDLPENLIVRYYGSMFQLFRDKQCLMGLHLQYIEDGEVIGNLYEHPHLLEGVK